MYNPTPYNSAMYKDDRKWLLDRIKFLRQAINEFALEGYDCLFDDNTIELHRRIKAHRELLVIARSRYYSSN